MSRFNADIFRLFVEFAPKKHDLLGHAICSGINRFAHRNVSITRMLDVGAGSGEITIPAFSCLYNSVAPRRCDIVTTLTVVEPNLQMIEGFLQHPSLFLVLNGRVALTLLPMPFSDAVDLYLKKLSPFDFVIASHVLYYLCPWRETLAIFGSLLDRNALLCIALRSSKNALQAFRAILLRERGRLFSPNCLCAEDVELEIDGEWHVIDVKTLDYYISIPSQYRSPETVGPVANLVCMLLGLEAEHWDNACDFRLLDFLEKHTTSAGSAEIPYSERVMWFRKR
jgi:hypothetical protein